MIKGTQKYTDEPYVKTLKELSEWAPYLPSGFEAVKYPDSQSLFTLGKAAIYPAGSWEISQFNKDAKFPMGVFLPPVDKAGDKCYISDHTDIALGMNAKAKNPEAAKKFLDWVASPEFAEIYSNALPGFFSLQDAKIAMKDPLAQEFISWRDKCKSTMPQLVPDSVARRAESGERTVGRERERHQRQADARASRQATARRSR